MIKNINKTFRTTLLITMLLVGTFVHAQDALPDDDGTGAGVQDQAVPIDDAVWLGLFAGVALAFYLIKKKQLINQ